MPLEDAAQPEILPVSPTLRLRRYTSRSSEADFAIALPWYQDAELVRLVDGPDAKPYDTVKKLAGMYTYLDSHGELYWIEELQNGKFAPVGDVTLQREDMPIVLGPASCRGRGIGKAVIRALILRAKALGWDHAAVHEIYSYNTASQKLFLSCGFREAGKTRLGNSYRLEF